MKLLVGGAGDLRDCGAGIRRGGGWGGMVGAVSWVNYDFFPSLDFPILVYFKENQTPQSVRDALNQPACPCPAFPTHTRQVGLALQGGGLAGR